MDPLKQVRRASVSVVIDTSCRTTPDEPWPPVIICGPEEDTPSPGGQPLLELVYDRLKVVGTLVEETGRKIIRVEVIDLGCEGLVCADTQGQPTLK